MAARPLQLDFMVDVPSSSVSKRAAPHRLARQSRDQGLGASPARYAVGMNDSIRVPPDPEAKAWLERDRRPPGVSDDTVEATGKLGEALEWVERARGRLYDFHQMSGHADLLIGEAAELLDDAGHRELAERVRAELVGRNVIEGRWTFQIVEEYDATYWRAVHALHRDVIDALVDGRFHVHESEMKERRRTKGHRRHRSRPQPDA